MSADFVDSAELLRLRVLLSHIIDHNGDHGGEVQAFAAMVRAAVGEETALLLDRAVLELCSANRSLQTLLDALGGPYSAG